MYRRRAWEREGHGGFSLLFFLLFSFSFSVSFVLYSFLLLSFSFRSRNVQLLNGISGRSGRKPVPCLLLLPRGEGDGRVVLLDPPGPTPSVFEDLTVEWIRDWERDWERDWARD